MKKKNNIFKKMDKRAELTTQQIVMMIILITSFAIILFFLFRLNLQETGDKEVCRNSVVLRGNSIIPSKTIPLNCKTSYVCITKDGTCEDLPYYNYRVNVKDKEDMYQTLADEMADCWWVFGEGEINYMGSEVVPDLYCSLCSQLTFDNSVLDITEFSSGKIDKNDFYFNYLAKEKVTGKDITYAEYLFGTAEFSQILEVSQSMEDKTKDYGSIDLKKTNAVIMGVYNDVSKLGWAFVGAGVTVAFIAIPFTAGSLATLATIQGVILVAGGAAVGSIVGITVEGISGNEFLAPTIISFPEEYDGLGCEHIETLG